MLRTLKKIASIFCVLLLSTTVSANDIIKTEYTVKSGDALISILKKNNVNKKDINNLIYNTKEIKKVNNLKIGQDLTFYVSPEGDLIKLLFEIDKKSVYVASKNKNKKSFKLKKGYYKLNEVHRYRIGKVKYSVNKTLSEMGLSSAQKKQFKEMFKDQLNLNKIRKGSELIAVYQEFYKGKEKQYTGALVAGEIKQGNNSKQAFLFKDSKGETGYFAKNGKPLSEGFDRSPLKDYKRISSSFKPKRKHPVLGYTRAHNGTDYAAKTGVPIFASASGKVAMKDYQKRGYGNVIVINHKDGYSTLYAHMSKVEKGIYAGKKVKKGQVIGYVGNTGLSTGSHLHFEIRKNGRYLNPETTKIPTGSKLAKKDVKSFKYFVKKQNEGFKLSRLLLKKEGRTTIAIRKKK